MEYTRKLMVLFLIILIGYLARKIRLVPEEAPDMVVKLILNITLPLLILVIPPYPPPVAGSSAARSVSLICTVPSPSTA